MGVGERAVSGQALKPGTDPARSPGGFEPELGAEFLASAAVLAAQAVDPAEEPEILPAEVS